MRKLMIIISMAFIVIAARGQSVLRGRVSQQDSGMPLAGVNVKVSGTDLGTVTDNAGDFTLRLADGSYRLAFSHIGNLSTEVVVRMPLQDTLKVALTMGERQLSEVTVHTGYQKIELSKATGSYNVIAGDLLERRVSATVLDRLEDVAPGLIFNRRASSNSTNISIRGQSTINANSDPLIILDNFPYEGDLASINPNDIESITLLKDAAAAAIWGARAGNGVIVMTSKSGRLKQSFKTSINSNIGLGQKPDVFYADRMATSDYIDIQQRLFNENYYRSLEQNDLNNVSHNALPPLVELLIARRDGQLSEAQAQEAIAMLAGNDLRRDIDRYLNRVAINQQYALNFSGGSALSTYYLGLGSDHNRQQQVGNEFGRISVQAKASQLTWGNRLQLNAGLFYSRTRQLRNALELLSAAPYQMLADPSGRPLSMPRYRSGFVSKMEGLGFLGWDYVPLQEQKNNDVTDRRADLRLDVGANLKLLEGLKAMVNYQFAESRGELTNYRNIENFYVRNLINTFTQIGSGNVLTRPVPLGGILDNSNSLSNSHVLRSQLDFSKRWGNGGQQLGILLGNELRSHTSSSASHRLYGYDDRYAVSQPVDYLGLYQSSAAAASRQSIPYSFSNAGLVDRFISYYLNANYSLLDRYFVSASARLDRSNLFGVETNQKGVPLYALGASWVLDKESFWNVRFVPELKFRASFGYNGNIDKNLSAYTTAMYFPSTGYAANRLTGRNYARIENPPNPELRWERVRIINLGVDFSLLASRRISGTIDFFRKDGLDLIGPTDFPGSSGIKRFVGNFATNRNNGVDLSLTTKNLTGAFSWTTNLLGSVVKDKVISYDHTVLPYNYVNTTGTPLVGKPLYKMFSFRWAGLDGATGDPLGYVGGQQSADYAAIINNSPLDQLVYHGSIRPTLFGAIRNTFMFKGFTADINISYRMGYYFRAPSIVYGTTYGLDNAHGDYARRWQSPGDEKFTYVPSVPKLANARRDTFYGYSEMLVQRGDHIRLQDIRLGYTFPKGSMVKAMGPLHFYLYVNNIGLLYKHTKMRVDPDFIESPPLGRTVAFGLTTDF